MSCNNLRDVVFEIGTEEIPARFMRGSMSELMRIATELFERERLNFSKLKAYGTPRRLVLYVEGMSDVQPDLEKRVKGPAAKVAFDSDGNPTKALQGFARGAGVDLTQVEVVKGDQGDYVYATVTEKGRPVKEVLAEVFSKVITSLSFPKTMRWGNREFRFVRPIRWILAMFGDEVVPFTFEDISASNLTQGHRTLHPGTFEVERAEDYVDDLKSIGVEVDPEVRKRSIVEQANRIAVDNGGVPVIDEDLLEEITFIVEWPTGFAGKFDAHYLEMPEPCVVTPMQDHQRYFPVKSEGRLLPLFIAFRNGGDEFIDNVRAGNERVLRARLADAKFFYDEDLTKSLADRVEELSDVMYQEKLGSMLDKEVRDEKLCKFIVERSDNFKGVISDSQIEEASKLCKADLVTSVVKEFSELQGIMGREYVSRQGGDAAIADAVCEHYMPRFAGDSLPSTPLGAVLAIADKMDTLVGYFAIGMIPSGSADPFALRRQALGIIQIHRQWKVQVSINELARQAYRLHSVSGKLKFDEEKTVCEVVNFVNGRLKMLLEEAGVEHDIVDAAISVPSTFPAKIMSVAKVLTAMRGDKRFEEFVTMFSRVRNIAVNAQGDHYDPKVLVEDAEVSLIEAFDKFKDTYTNDMASDSNEADIADYIEGSCGLTETVNQFFESVMVMSEDPVIKENRLGLLKSIQNTLALVADYSKITF